MTDDDVDSEPRSRAQTDLATAFRGQLHAMVDGDTEVLDDLLDDGFTLTHMTGYVQPKVRPGRRANAGASLPGRTTRECRRPGSVRRPGWAVPVAPLTVIATVDGVMDRPVVIDSAPAARFTETLRTLVEKAAAFEDAAG